MTDILQQLYIKGLISQQALLDHYGLKELSKRDIEVEKALSRLGQPVCPEKCLDALIIVK